MKHQIDAPGLLRLVTLGTCTPHIRIIKVANVAQHIDSIAVTFFEHARPH
jgi:hypothetical protein